MISSTRPLRVGEAVRDSLPLLIIGKQMGANPDDIWQIKEWTEAFLHRISLMQSEEEELIPFARKSRLSTIFSRFLSGCE